ncbi:LutC/YkgG family protein [Gorillibacterium massiliense]|uniref:LutC/YkgG family protein n=1 Tax=Gorillibacterium massiliense TaxID=1280390 RepID=UPI0004ACCC11|nr:LUD domain-containing protein [Gorillibacterium massiliense]
MGDTYKAWLDEREAESRRMQEAMMNGIAGRLNRPRPLSAPQHPFRGAPDFWEQVEWPLPERLARFAANFTAAGGIVERLPDWDAAGEYIARQAEKLGARYVVRQNQPELDALQLGERLPEEARITRWNRDPAEDMRARAAEADIGIILADHAVASTGSIVAVSHRDKGRSVSLLPTALFALIPVERVKTRLGEVLAGFDQAGQSALPAGIHFISGPSRSADIENDLTIGVHGPGIVFALLVG